MNTSAPTAPSARTIRDRIGDFADWINPMLVKELRQGMRTWVFVALFVFLQVVGSLILLGGEFNETFAREVSAGLFWGLIVLILIVFQPLRAISALSQEKKNKTMDFLEVSNLTALKIVWGKWLSIFAQSCLIIVSLLPYFILRYFQGGIDLIQEAIGLLVVLLLSGLFTAVVTATSTEESKVKLAFLYVPVCLIGGGFFISLFLTNMTGGGFVLRGLNNSLGLMMSGWVIAGGGVFLLLIWACIIWVFISWAAQIIAPRSENLSTPVRLIALTVWLVTAALSLTVNKNFTAGVTLTTVVLVTITVLMVIQSLSERVSILPPVLLPFVKKGLLGRLAGRVLYPGWTSGIMYALIMTGLFFGWLMVRYPSATEMKNSSVLLWLVWGIFVLPAMLLYGFCHWSKDRKPTTYFSVFLIVHFVCSMVSGMNLAAKRSSDAGTKVSDWLAYVSPSSALIYYLRYQHKRGLDPVMISALVMVLVYTLWLLWRVIVHNRDLIRAEKQLNFVRLQKPEKSL
jgi:hypothetical protein